MPSRDKVDAFRAQRFLFHNMKSVTKPAGAKSAKTVPTTKQLRAHTRMTKGATEFVTTSSDNPLAFAVIVEGDSMAPEIRHGDRAVIVPSKTMPENGSAVLCRLKDGRLFIRWFYRVRGNRVRLEASDPKHSPLEFNPQEIKSVSNVLEIVRIVPNRHADMPEDFRKIMQGTCN
jgi:SOS-response transcriptional repressor LexA